MTTLNNEQLLVVYNIAISKKHPDPIGFVSRTDLVNKKEGFASESGVGVTGVPKKLFENLGGVNPDEFLSNIAIASDVDISSFAIYYNSTDYMHLSFLRGEEAIVDPSEDDLELLNQINSNREYIQVVVGSLYNKTSNSLELVTALDKTPAPVLNVLPDELQERLLNNLEENLQDSDLVNIVIQMMDKIKVEVI